MPKPKRNIHAVAQDTVNPPDALSAGQTIARVKLAAGNNLYHLELPSGDALLAELPAKFRSVIWIKRGSYVLVDTTALAVRDNKLGGEIINIVRDEKAWRKMPFWPAEFVRRELISGDDSEDEGPKMPSSSSDDDK